MLREANGTPVVAASDGLRFAMPDHTQPMRVWTAQSLASPEIDWQQRWRFGFDDIARCKAFCKRASALCGDYIGVVASGNEAAVNAHRHVMLALVTLAANDFDGQVPVPGAAALSW